MNCQSLKHSGQVGFPASLLASTVATMSANRNLFTVAHEFLGLANAVLAGTNNLIQTEDQLAKQVLAKEQELGALRQRSAILSAERSKFRETTEKLKAVHAAKVSTELRGHMNQSVISFGMLQ
jgi:hypothetical protein